MQPLARSAGKRDEAVDHRGAEVCETVNIERRELLQRDNLDENRPTIRMRIRRRGDSEGRA